MNSRRILVTGAGGFVGAAVVKTALARGHEVLAVVRRDQARLSPVLHRIKIERLDLSDLAATKTLLSSQTPDIVIHCAWEGVGGALRAGDIQLENIRTTIALVDAAIAAGTGKFVGIGSQAEYGRYDRRIVETDLAQPTMLYGAAKLAAYHLARQRCLEQNIGFAWLRLFSVYGPGDNLNWLIPSTAASLMRGQVPRCTKGTQKWDYLHIDDVAEAIIAAATSDDATGVFNLSSGDPVAIRTIVQMLRDLAAPELPLDFGAIPFGPDQIMHLEGDNQRLCDATGWRPRTALADGLSQLIEQMKMAA